MQRIGNLYQAFHQRAPGGFQQWIICHCMEHRIEKEIYLRDARSSTMHLLIRYSIVELGIWKRLFFPLQI